MPADKVAKQGVSAEKFAVLRQHPIFRDLDAAALDQLSRYCKMRTVPRGTVIFSKGDPGTSLFAMGKGTGRIGVTAADGRGAVFNIIGPGELSGERSVLC